jgi:hypothetical protein
MTDPDTINEVKAEERAYYQWLREMKNKVLAIHNPQRRQEVWREKIGVRSEPDDQYLLGNVF